MEIEMKIRGLMIDPSANTPIVILKDVNSDTMLPIWVGAYEANAIALEIEKIAPQRPMTHDLLKNVINQMGASVQRIVVTDLIDNTFYAAFCAWLTISSVSSHSNVVVFAGSSPSFLASSLKKSRFSGSL